MYVGGWKEDGRSSGIVRKGGGHSYFIVHF